MIIHISSHELINTCVGITPKMKEDLAKCYKRNEYGSGACNGCSWENVEMYFTFRDAEEFLPPPLERIGVRLCGTREVLKAVLGEDYICDECFGTSAVITETMK